MDHLGPTAIQEQPGSSSRARVPFSANRIAESFAFCQRLTHSHYENFPVGSLLIPTEVRRYVYAVYAFARLADDMADEGYEKGLSVESRQESLDDWGRQLEACTEGKAEHVVFPAVAATLLETQLPIDLLRALLSAFRQDVGTQRYASFPALLDYCRRSANPIGRVILFLFGYRDEERAQLSDSICTALQLTNFWQDISVDVEKDRIYLPADEMEQFGVTVEQIQEGRFTRELAELLAFEVARTRQMFGQGKPLLDIVSGRLRYELRLTWLGGMSILEKIEGAGFDSLRSRPTLSSRDKLSILAKALLSKV